MLNCFNMMLFYDKILMVMNMKIGKVPNSVLEGLISNIKNREEVIVGSHIGKDTAILDFKGKLIVLSTDPITGTSKDIGKLAINVAVNDLATQGAEPVAAILTILAPEGTTEGELIEVMQDAKDTANAINLSIVGGHTEITDAVTRLVVNAAVLGSIDWPYVVPEIEVNDLLVVTKSLGIEGISIIAKEKEAELKTFLTDEEYAEALAFENQTSVIKDGYLGKKYGAKYMHDITEGGLLGAAWEAARANDIGLVVFNNRLPIKEVVKKICEFYKVDSRKLISSGSMMMIISQEDYLKLLPEFEEEGIESTIIGRVTDFDGVFIRENGKMIPIGEPKSDELYSVL